MPLYSIPIFSLARTHLFPRYFPFFLSPFFWLFFFHRSPRCAIFSLVITSRRWKQCSVSSPWRSPLVIKPFYPCSLLAAPHPPYSSPFSRFSSPLHHLTTRVSCNFVICTPALRVRFVFRAHPSTFLSWFFFWPFAAFFVVFVYHRFTLKCVSYIRRWYCSLQWLFVELFNHFICKWHRWNLFVETMISFLNYSQCFAVNLPNSLK